MKTVSVFAAKLVVVAFVVTAGHRFSGAASPTRRGTSSAESKTSRKQKTVVSRYAFFRKIVSELPKPGDQNWQPLVEAVRRNLGSVQKWGEHRQGDAAIDLVDLLRPHAEAIEALALSIGTGNFYINSSGAKMTVSELQDFRVWEAWRWQLLDSATAFHRLRQGPRLSPLTSPTDLEAAVTRRFLRNSQFRVAELGNAGSKPHVDNLQFQSSLALIGPGTARHEALGSNADPSTIEVLDLRGQSRTVALEPNGSGYALPGWFLYIFPGKRMPVGPPRLHDLTVHRTLRMVELGLFHVLDEEDTNWPNRYGVRFSVRPEKLEKLVEAWHKFETERLAAQDDSNN